MSLQAPQATQTEAYRQAQHWLSAGPKRLLVGGKWSEAASGQTFQTIDPSSEQTLADVAAAGEQDTEEAVAAARRAFESAAWSRATPHARTVWLLKIAENIERHAGELAVLETLDNGTPLTSAARWVASCAQTFRYYAGWPTKIYGSTIPTDPDRFIYMLREPVGVCALINPWNAPLTQATNKIAPALACGNTVIMKPAEQTPLSTLRLAELIQEADLPPGVVNILPGAGRSIGNALTMHPGVDKISFTGSTEIGRKVMIAAASTFKKVTLELGGKSPNIIFPDANLDAAIAAAVSGFCRNSGQICSAGTRLFVHESIHDEVAERVAAIAAGYKVGSPFDADTQMGPVISAKQMASVLSYVDIGQREGATLSLEGGRRGDKGFFVEPTVFSHVSNNMAIARDEIFGPVLSVIPFKDEDDAVFEGNNTEYGLAAAVWTADASRAHRVARRLKAGRVWINTYAEVDSAMSMGGYKQSGLGREMGAESIDAFTQTKSVLMRLNG